MSEKRPLLVEDPDIEADPNELLAKDASKSRESDPHPGELEPRSSKSHSERQSEDRTPANEKEGRRATTNIFKGRSETKESGAAAVAASGSSPDLQKKVNMPLFTANPHECLAEDEEELVAGLCNELYQREEWSHLLELAEEHIEKKEGRCFSAYFYAGNAAYKLNRFKEALLFFHQAEKLRPNDAQLHYNIGITYFKRGSHNLAVVHLSKCIESNPRHMYAYNNLAYIYNLNNLFKDTDRVCEKASKNNPFALGTYRHWAYALMKEKDLCDAVKKIKTAIEIDPADSENWVVWGLIMRANGDFKNSLTKFEKAVELDPKNYIALYEKNFIEKMLQLDKETEGPIHLVDEGASEKRMCSNSNCAIF